MNKCGNCRFIAQAGDTQYCAVNGDCVKGFFKIAKEQEMYWEKKTLWQKLRAWIRKITRSRT